LHRIIHDFSFVTYCNGFARQKGVPLNAGFETDFGI
jgi:hypothetical protein